MDKEIAVIISVEYYSAIKIRESYHLQQQGITLSEISQRQILSDLTLESKTKTKTKTPNS